MNKTMEKSISLWLSHTVRGVDEVKLGGKPNDALSVNIAKDAIDEWSEEAQTHHF